MSGSECQWPQPLVRKYRADWGADKYYIAYFRNGETCVTRYVAILENSDSLVTLLLGLHAVSRRTRATTKSRPRVYQIYVDVGGRAAPRDPVRVLGRDYPLNFRISVWRVSTEDSIYWILKCKISRSRLVTRLEAGTYTKKGDDYRSDYDSGRPLFATHTRRAREHTCASG